jgi:hypothetical protein
MRIRRSIIVVFALIAIAVVVFAALALVSSSPSEFKAADGSVLRVEKSVYGKRGTFVPPVGWKERVGSWIEPILPKSLKSRVARGATNFMGNWQLVSLVHSNNDALHLWVTRRDSLTGQFRDVGVGSGEITDSHGCVYRFAQSGGENHLPPTTAPSAPFVGAQSSVVWLSFEGFPRHETRFNLRLYNMNGGFLGEMMIANPAPGPKPAGWTVGPLPVLQKQENILFALTKVALKTNNAVRNPGVSRSGLPFELIPTFEVTTDGVLTKDWKALEFELWDSSGNFASSVFSSHLSLGLCPRESAWKLIATFYGCENASAASNIVWKLPGVKVPGPGEFTKIETQTMPPGMTIRPIAIGGVGETVYSNGVTVSATVLSGPQQPNPINRSFWKGAYASTVQEVRGMLPHVAVSVAGLTNSQQLTICAHDDQGREVYADQWRYGGLRDRQQPSDIHYLPGDDKQDPAFFELNLWPDAKTVDLTFCVHNPRTVEFIFKPPQPDTK